MTPSPLKNLDRVFLELVEESLAVGEVGFWFPGGILIRVFMPEDEELASQFLYWCSKISDTLYSSWPSVMTGHGHFGGCWPSDSSER